MAGPPTIVTLRYGVQPLRDDWELPEEPVPESLLHSQAVDLIKALLLHWVARTRLDAQVASNLAVRWVRERPKVGLDPDVCLTEVPQEDAADALAIAISHAHSMRMADLKTGK